LNNRVIFFGVGSFPLLLSRLRYFLCLCIWICCANNAMASNDPVVEQVFFVDSNSQFDINSIPEAPFKAFEKRLNLGYQAAPVWVRMRISPGVVSSAADAAIKQMILRIGPHDANQIEVYEFDRGQWQFQTVGDLFPQLEKSCADDYYCVNLRESTSQSNTIYLKIQTTNFLILDTEVVTLRKLSAVTADRIKRIFISLTLASVMLVIGIFWFIKYRSSMTACFVGIQASIFIYLLSIYGFLSTWFVDLPPELLDTLPYSMFILRSFFSILTIFVVIKAYCDSRLYFIMVYVILFGCVLNSVLLFTEHRNFSIRFNLLIFSVYPSIHLYGMFKSRGLLKNIKILLFAACILFYLVLLPVLVGSIFLNPSNSFAGPIQNISDWRLNGLAVGAIIFLLIKFEEEYREKQKADEINKIRIDKIEADSYAALLSDRNTMIDLLTHDLKNSLGTIKFASRALKEQIHGNQAATQKLRHIDQCANRMNNLIEHVAVSAHLDRYEITSSVMDSSAVELIEELIETYVEQIRFHLSVEENLGFKADREMLTVIFSNLINNAYKYGHAGGAILISVKRTNMPLDGQTEVGSEASETASVCFEISNAVGTFGMPDQDRVFERYYRHPNSIAVPGMGLGLSLVKAAAAKIGASVDFRLARDTVTFTVKIPN